MSAADTASRSPRGPLLVATVAGAALLVLAITVIPWSAAGWPVAPSAAGSGEVGDLALQDRIDSLAAAVDGWLLVRWALPTLAAVGMVLLSRGRLGRIRGSRWWLPPVAVAAVVLAGLPAALGVAHARRAAGLDLAGWSEWWLRWISQAAVLVIVATAGLWAVLEWRKRHRGRWWIAASGLMAGAVAVGSLLLPAIDRVDGVRADPPLEAMVVELGEDRGVAVGEVVVVEIGDRTTTANAVVSGWGPTRQVAFTDTLVDLLEPGELRWIAAHELAHARFADVGVATVLGALGAIVVVSLTAAAISWAPLRTRLRIGPGADPRVATTLILAIVAATLVATPFAAAMSRAVEARADATALEWTGDRAAMLGAIDALTRANLTSSTPTPWRYALFVTHPLPGSRVAASGHR